MDLVPYQDEVADVDKVYRCLRDNIPPTAIHAAMSSQVAINLVPLTSDLSSAPNRTDLEVHRSVVIALLTAFPEKAANESTLVEGSRERVGHGSIR